MGGSAKLVTRHMRGWSRACLAAGCGCILSSCRGHVPAAQLAPGGEAPPDQARVQAGAQQLPGVVRPERHTFIGQARNVPQRVQALDT